MKLAMEIPHDNLDDLSMFCDFDFALYHLADSNKDYRNYYRGRAKVGREVWLDTSFHELKACPSCQQMIEMAELMLCTHVVAPEVLNNHAETIALIEEMFYTIKRNGIQINLVGSWQGEIADIPVYAEFCRVIALPFDRDREGVCREFPMGKFHFFGFKSLQELMLYNPESIDTSMPIRAALEGIDLLHYDRGKDTFLDYNRKLRRYELDETVRNIGLLKLFGRKEGYAPQDSQRHLQLSSSITSYTG